MALANARFYRSGKFFWDERAPTLEAQVLQPIQNEIEMGMKLTTLEDKLKATAFYPPLFNAAFGSPDITSDRVARALAQFVRALMSAQAPFDSVYARGDVADLSVLSPQAQQGSRLFAEVGCANCHRTSAHFGDNAHNTGLDAVPLDSGAGHGRFKPPSLRNIEVRPPYMHDGRFSTLDEVIAFYDTGVQASVDLDPRLRSPDGSPRHLNLSAAQRSSIVAFLHALTDHVFLTAPKFSNPF
jgi:cytochrome c peroxidase